MILVQLPGRRVLFGERVGTTAQRLVLAGGFYLLTLLLSLVGRILLTEWSTTTAHLGIELLAVALFVSAIGTATLNGYYKGGLVVSVMLVLSLIIGFCTVIIMMAFTGGLRMPQSAVVESLGTLVGLAASIGASAYLVGVSVRQLLHEHQRNQY